MTSCDGLGWGKIRLLRLKRLTAGHSTMSSSEMQSATASCRARSPSAGSPQSESLLLRVYAARRGKPAFNTMHFFFFLSCPSQSCPAHFCQKPIKGRAKSSLRQPSHSGMQAPGLAAGRHPVEERRRDSAKERKVGPERSREVTEQTAFVRVSRQPSKGALGSCAHA